MRRVIRKAQGGEMGVMEESATYGGVAWKSVVYGVLTIIAAAVVALILDVAIEHQNETLLTVVFVGVSVCAVPMIIVSLVIAFVPSTVKVLGCIYSLLQGSLLGVVSYIVDAFMPGITFAVVLATAIVFVVSVALNKLLEVRISNKFFRVMFVAFMCFLVLELLLFVLSLFVANFELLFSAYIWIQLGISAFCVIYASVLLLWDLQSVDAVVKSGVDKKYEWYVAFSLVTTLVYLYVEILELVVRLVAIFGKSRN